MTKNEAVFVFVTFLFIIQIFGTTIIQAVAASETALFSTPTPTPNILINNSCNTYIKNQTTAVANTGENSSIKNTGSSYLFSGNATLVSHLVNQACNSDIKISSQPNYFSDSEEIRQLRIEVLNKNNADVENQTTTVGNTGKNIASENTNDSSILTGNAGQVSYLSNQVGISDISIESASGFNIDSEEIMQHIIKVININNSRVKNIDKMLSNTGDNQVDQNSGFTRILTGNSSFEFLSDTFLNTLNFLWIASNF